MGDKTENLIKNLEELLKLKKVNSSTLFRISTHLFKLNWKRGILLFCFFCILFTILRFIMFSHNTAIEIFSGLTTDVNTILIPIFAVIITGYAIFQALANGKAVITLLTVNHKNKDSKFRIYNLYFFGIACWYLLLIIVNFVLMFIFKYISPYWYFPYFSIGVNEVISAILISIYLCIILYLLIEMKSFIYNLFQVFITSASAVSIEQLENNKAKNDGK